MEKDEALALLKAARKSTKMTTTYDLPADAAPVLPQVAGGLMRPSRVTVRTFDNGYVEIHVTGHSVTKAGVRKSGNAWFSTTWDVDQVFAAALSEL